MGFKKGKEAKGQRKSYGLQLQRKQKELVLK